MRPARRTVQRITPRLIDNDGRLDVADQHDGGGGNPLRVHHVFQHDHALINHLRLEELGKQLQENVRKIIRRCTVGSFLYLSMIG